MRVVITGGRGQLGRTLVRRFAAHQVTAVDLPEVDVTHREAMMELVAASAPDVVIHAAAFTAVDRCETERDEAFRVNATGAGHVAVACHSHGVRLIAISTDYVFSGELDRPYHEWDTPAPRSVYGASKLAGEEAVRAHCPDHCIVRVGWLYGPGGPSFLHTMLRLGAEAGEPLKVVDDQVGNPTSTDAVADGLAHLLEAPLAGTVHLTCGGETTWHGFAQAIFEHRPPRRALVPCTTADYPRPAPRPANSRLEKRALRINGLPPMPDWREALDRFFREHPDG